MPNIDGTLVGESVQIARPESDISFAWSEEPSGRALALTDDGRCVARQSDDGLMVLDMVNGETFELDLPADFIDFVD